VKFCWQHCNENKLAEKFSLNWIQVPGENPHVVLRRQEKDAVGKVFVGWIVVLREQVFNAIDEWH
jgi:hypothetical protein